MQLACDAQRKSLMFRAARHSTSAHSFVRQVRREASIVSNTTGMGQKKHIDIEIISDTIWCAQPPTTRPEMLPDL